jgi:hypothetical protein
MRVLIFVFIGAPLLSVAAFAQKPPDPTLRQAVEARETALASGDPDTWGRFTTDDFVRIEEDGGVTTKAERMARLKAEPMRPRERSEHRWRMYGTTAIETWRQSRSDQVLRITQVWVLRDGRWQVATTHRSNVVRR